MSLKHTNYVLREEEIPPTEPAPTQQPQETVQTNEEFTFSNILYILACLVYYHSAKAASMAAHQVSPELFVIKDMLATNVQPPNSDETAEDDILATQAEEFEQQDPIASEMSEIKQKMSEELSDEASTQE